MVQAVDAMLELRNFPERLKRKGAGTVSEMEDVLERMPDELARNVMRQGILMGQALLLRDQAARRFDKRTAAWLCYLVDLSGRDSIDRVAAALFECGTEAEFLERVQTENGKPPQTGGAQDVEAQRSTQLVSMKTLQLRHPDMIWSADTVHGRRVMILIEFQRTAEWLMALRTTTYTALTLERIAGREDFRTSDPLPEFVYLVLYHGDGPWIAPARVADLFQRSDPGRFRLISWREAEGTGRPRDDITALVLGLARNLSPEDMATQLAALRFTMEGHGDAGLNAFMVERVDNLGLLGRREWRVPLSAGRTLARAAPKVLVERMDIKSTDAEAVGSESGRPA